MAEQLDYSVDVERQSAEDHIANLNEEQTAVFNAVTHSAVEKEGHLFFLHGPAGTGKTFVYNTICCHLQLQQKIVLCVASSGIAALLLAGGHTAHNHFKVPLELHEDTTCNIPVTSELAELICNTDLIIWDEVPMQSKKVADAVSHTLGDIMQNDRPFGGITVVFGGDFQQTLPVVVHGT